MKNLFLFLSLFLLVCCKTQYDVVRKVDKEHRQSPPGTIWIKDSIYMDMCEVRNLDYLEYVHWTKKFDSINYSKVLPDTLVWKNGLTYNEPYVNMYFWHPAFRNYPAVGVSYEQAQGFCKWRTQRVKELIKLRKHNNTIEETFGAKDFYYRLPTKEEWEYAASAGTGMKYGFVKMQSKDNSPNFNVKETQLLGYESFGGDITTPVLSKKANGFGLYNTIGNVAEMITEKGVSKGGSWKNSITECAIQDSLKYDRPSAWLGFRCVCIITK